VLVLERYGTVDGQYGARHGASRVLRART
jgi:hypothetical protein